MASASLQLRDLLLQGLTLKGRHRLRASAEGTVHLPEAASPGSSAVASQAREARPAGCLRALLALSGLAVLERGDASSFIATTTAWDEVNFTDANRFMSTRGPDGTRCMRLRGLTACHNLLHVAGEPQEQPLVDIDRGLLAVYDGQIYNYRTLARQLGLAAPRSDCEVVLPLYVRHGPTFARHLDGEFAVAIFDLQAGKAVLATDAFSTKPLWYARGHAGLSVASYRSGLLSLGVPAQRARLADPNSVTVLELSAVGHVPRVLQRQTVFEFDLRQFKPDVVDFVEALDRAVKKRVSRDNPPFIGLSSGHASGALQVQLGLVKHLHAAYMVFGGEDIATVEGRLVWAKDIVDGHIFIPSEGQISSEEIALRGQCEPHASNESGLGVVDNPEAYGLSLLFREAKKQGLRFFLSAAGPDDLMSGLGLFPEDLSKVFPWRSLLLGRQRDHLMLEELVAGVHGIDVRYPFLDRAVVQEYLWLSASVKNDKYMAPLHQLMEAANYPFRLGMKPGLESKRLLQVGDSAMELRRGNFDSARLEEVSEVEISLDFSEVELFGAEKHVQEREAQLLELNKEVEAVQETLQLREANFAKEVREHDIERMQRIQMMLFTMVPRFAVMLHKAAPTEKGIRSDRPVHSRWHSVEVVTCVTGGADVVVADFPMYQIFRATTPLDVLHNVCEDKKWEGINFRLRMYEKFFRELREQPSARKDILYYVVDGLDLFFNDVSKVAEHNPDGDMEHNETVAFATARVIAERYEAIADPGGGRARRPIIASTERLCGWGGARLCSDTDEARYPEAPTDSKYLNAGGFLGPAEELSEMITAVLRMKSTATGERKEMGQSSDQYFFKLYYWDNQDRIALDYHQSIFGNFLEIANRPCESDWAPKCAVYPCCTESDDFKRFHRLFYDRYRVEGCSVWRKDNLPVSWHGNGAGKWIFLLALDQLSLRCGPAANVTRTQMPEEMVAGAFDRYEDRARLEGTRWPGGFLSSVATHLRERLETTEHRS